MKKTPKHAIYYSVDYGRNDGPSLYYYNRLKAMFGAENVHHLDPTQPNVERDGPYDYHWWIDWGEDAVLGREKALEDMIPHDGGKRIYVVSDAHLDDGYRFTKALQFDYVFFNQKHYVDDFVKERGQKEFTAPQPSLFYLPHAAEPEAYPHFEIIKKYDLCFIGHIQEYHKGNGLNMARIDVLDAMFKAIPNFYFGTRNPAFPDKNLFEDAAKKFCQSKVVFNVTIGNDSNMRLAETLVTGSFLLTNWIPELENLEAYGLIDGVHYVSYRTLEEAIVRARYYGAHDYERELIAKKGYEQALKTGTYESRIREIAEKVGLPIPNK